MVLAIENGDVPEERMAWFRIELINLEAWDSVLTVGM
jgi:hypothetical protein